MHPMKLAYHNLANAIIVQAVTDYRKALDGISYCYRPPEKIIQEVEQFFRSEYYKSLTKIDGEYLISKLKKEHQEKVRKEQLCE